jgi:Flp pilus assembly protein TadD
MQRPPARLLASVAILAAVAVSGCSTTTTGSSPDTTGSIATDTAPRSTVQWRQEMDSWGERYRNNPSDAVAAVRYAQALRAVGQRAQAAAVLEQAAIHNGDNRVVLGAYGRALADNGSYQRPWTRSTARIRRTSPTDASCRSRARCSTKWAATPTRSGTMPARYA